MAGVHRAAAVPPAAVQIADAFGNAERYLGTLGSHRTTAGDTFTDHLANNPGDITVWASSRRQTVEAIDKRTFARALLALIDVANLVGPGAAGVGAAIPPPAAPPPVVAVPMAVRMPAFAGPPATLAVRRGVIAYRMHAAQQRPTWQTWWVAATSWFPQWLTSVLIFMVIGLLSRPETLLIVPLKMLSFLQAYASFAIERMIGRAEFELSLMFFGGGQTALPYNNKNFALPPASSESNGPMHPGPSSSPFAPSAQWATFGWAAAVLSLLLRRN